MELRTVTDQMGRSVELPVHPMRIISLVPSQTELLYDLGLAHRIAGQTIFCVHPRAAFESAVKVGGTKKLQLDKIRTLKPDLIIGNKEENEQSQIEILEKEFPVWMSDIHTLEDALVMIRSVGDITDTAIRANEIAAGIESVFDDLHIRPRGSALYLIWRDPWMAAGRKTFIHQMLRTAGFRNIITDPESRYPELTTEQIQKLSPDCILLSSEPYPFREKHIAELQAVCPDAQIVLVDGEMFSWYGSRLLKAPGYICQLGKGFV